MARRSICATGRPADPGLAAVAPGTGGGLELGVGALPDQVLRPHGRRRRLPSSAIGGTARFSAQASRGRIAGHANPAVGKRAHRPRLRAGHRPRNDPCRPESWPSCDVQSHDYVPHGFAAGDRRLSAGWRPGRLGHVPADGREGEVGQPGPRPALLSHSRGQHQRPTHAGFAGEDRVCLPAGAAADGRFARPDLRGFHGCAAECTALAPRGAVARRLCHGAVPPGDGRGAWPAPALGLRPAGMGRRLLAASDCLRIGRVLRRRRRAATPAPRQRECEPAGSALRWPHKYDLFGVQTSATNYDEACDLVLRSARQGARRSFRCTPSMPS